MTSERPFGARSVKYLIYLLLAFPIVNYSLTTVVGGTASIWGFIVLLLLSIIALVRYLSGHRPTPFRWSKYALWYILYCIALMMAGFKNPTVSFDGFSMDVEYIWFGLLLPFVIETEDVFTFIYVAVIVSIFLGIDGIFQYLVKVPIPIGWLDVGEHVRTRVFSVIGSPAELGANMEMMIPIIFALLIVDKHRVRRWMYALGGLACLGTLLFTYDRGSWLGFGVALLFIAVVYERRLLIVLVALAAIAFFLPAVHHRIMDLFSPVYYIQSAQGGRILRWESAFDKMAINPLFGAGLGRYGGAIASTYGYSIYSDSYYMKILGESGLIGLVLFLTMHVAIVREIMQTVVKRAKGTDRYLALGGLTGITAILVHNFVENLFEYAPTVVLYFMMVGLFLLWGRTLTPGKHELRLEQPVRDTVSKNGYTSHS